MSTQNHNEKVITTKIVAYSRMCMSRILACACRVFSHVHMQKLQVVQNKVRRVDLGANRYAAIEAIRGVIGQSTFSERCMKGSLMYKKRVERMEETKWVKKVCENVGQMSKWSGVAYVKGQ